MSAGNEVFVSVIGITPSPRNGDLLIPAKLYRLPNGKMLIKVTNPIVFGPGHDPLTLDNAPANGEVVLLTREPDGRWSARADTVENQDAYQQHTLNGPNLLAIQPDNGAVYLAVFVTVNP